MGSTISQSESNVASFFADDNNQLDDDNFYATNTNSNPNNQHQYSTTTSSKLHSKNTTNCSTNTTTILPHHNNIYLLGCSDSGKTTLHTQLKSKFNLKLHKNEKCRLTLILKTILSTLSDIIHQVMSPTTTERSDFFQQLKKSDPQILNFLQHDLLTLSRKWEFSKSESIQIGQFIRILWSKYKIIQQLYFEHHDSHHLNDNIDRLCNEMNQIIIHSQISTSTSLSKQQELNFFKRKNTRRKIQSRLNSASDEVINSTLCHQLEEDEEEQQQPNISNDSDDLYQLDNHIDTVMQKPSKKHLFSISSNSINSISKNGNSKNSYIQIDKYSPLIRFLTIGKSETNFHFPQFSASSFSLLDLGGRGAEKKKWEFFLNEKSANFVLYFVSLSEFNQNLIENDHVNRLQESLSLYGDVMSRALLRETKEFIVVFTKPDLFRRKIENGILPDLEKVIKKESSTNEIPKMEIRPEFDKLRNDLQSPISNLINLFENVYKNSSISSNGNNSSFKYHIVNLIDMKECQEFIEILLRQLIVKDYIENYLKKSTSISHTPFISKCLMRESEMEVVRSCAFSDCFIKTVF